MARGYRSEDQGAEYPEHVRCTKATDLALFIHDDANEESFWVPRSVIHDDSEVYEDGHEGTLVVAEWWAEKEGWG